MKIGKQNIYCRHKTKIIKISIQELVSSSKLLSLNIKVLFKMNSKIQLVAMSSLVFINKNNQKLLKKIIVNKMQKSDQALCKLVSSMKNINKFEWETIIKLQIFHKLSRNQKLKMMRVIN